MLHEARCSRDSPGFTEIIMQAAPCDLVAVTSVHNLAEDGRHFLTSNSHWFLVKFLHEVIPLHEPSVAII